MRSLPPAGAATEAIGHYDRACRFAAQGHWAAALLAFDDAAQRGLDTAELHYGRATVLQQTGRHEEAVASFDAALRRNPSLLFALNNRGTALLELSRAPEALEGFDAALRLDATYVRAWSNRSRALLELRRPAEACESAERALALNPEDAGALNNRGNALWDLGRHQAAIESYERALRINPAFVLALSNLCKALQNMQRHHDAARHLERLLALAPHWREARGNLVSSRLHFCDWTSHDADTAALLAALERQQDTIDPFQLLSISASAPLQLACARAYADQKLGSAPTSRSSLPAQPADRIRVGYLSSDFRSHAVAFLLARLFELHDRTTFETIALALRPYDDTAMGRRLAAAFERTCDLGRMDDRHAADAIRELGVDILVDLNGFTLGSRTGILRQRPAPVQVNYLGFPGTMGTGFHDYIIADDFVIPERYVGAYSEQVVWLPDCFQANDDRRPRIETPPSRAEEGLPADGRVLCCFNGLNKITPQIYSVWMRVLSAVPDSVLWLVAEDEHAKRNLRREALASGVDPSRLIFARKRTYEDHLRRIALADLFLDTFPFNAGTTASDALWAGVPLLTRVGEAYASRMAGSLLRSLALPELIADSLQAYEETAVTLASRPDLLGALRSRLAIHRFTRAAFDSDRFRRHIEAAYRTMWRRHRDGLPPAGFAVEPDAAVSARSLTNRPRGRPC